MATNLEHVATHAVTATTPGNLLRGLWDRATRSIQSAVCGLHGHDPLLQVQGARMFLRCTTCGYETPAGQPRAVVLASDLKATNSAIV